MRFYVANASTQVEQPGVMVRAEKTVRANAKILGRDEEQAQQTYVITGKVPRSTSAARASPPSSTRATRATCRPAATTATSSTALPAPSSTARATFDRRSTGLENIYIINGLNVTGLDLGNLDIGIGSMGGGTNLPIEFMTQIDVNSGGYQAEYGGAMGGVINSVLKSGSNDFHGSVFTMWSPYWMTGNPNPVVLTGASLGNMCSPTTTSPLAPRSAAR